MQKPHLHKKRAKSETFCAKPLQELSTIGEHGWQEFVRKLVPDLTDQDDLDKLTKQEIEEKVFPLIYERMARQLIQRSREQTQRWSVEAARDAFVKQVMNIMEELNKHDLKYAY